MWAEDSGWWDPALDLGGSVTFGKSLLSRFFFIVIFIMVTVLHTKHLQSPLTLTTALQVELLTAPSTRIRKSGSRSSSSCPDQLASTVVKIGLALCFKAMQVWWAAGRAQALP